jgi:hypothetical protein
LGRGLKLFTIKKTNSLRNVTQGLGFVKEDEIGGEFSTHGRDEKCKQLWSENKRRLGIPRHRWKDVLF